MRVLKLPVEPISKIVFDDYDLLALVDTQQNVAPDTPMHLSDTVFGIITGARLLDVIEELIGSEIVSNPVQHIRMKLPQRALAAEGARNYLTASVSWHQDLGVLMEEADAATILSCWMAVTVNSIGKTRPLPVRP